VIGAILSEKARVLSQSQACGLLWHSTAGRLP
jgi:hypothetical protein